jgi:hypothetical protein
MAAEMQADSETLLLSLSPSSLVPQASLLPPSHFATLNDARARVGCACDLHNNITAWIVRPRGRRIQISLRPGSFVRRV